MRLLEALSAGVLFQNLIDTLSAVLEHGFDIPSDGGRRGNDSGRPASLHECDELRIGHNLRGPGTFDAPAGEVSSSFFRGMHAMGDLNRRLALSCEAGKDRAVPTDRHRFGSKRRINNILAEASYGMGFQIGRRTAVLRILETPNAVETLVAASLGSTLEEMVLAVFVVADGNTASEELINW